MKPRFFLAFLVLVFLTACNGFVQVGLEHTPQAGTATVISLPSSTPLVLTATPTSTQPAPTLPAPTLPAPTLPVPTNTSAVPTKTLGPQMVQVILIALDDNGQGGPMVGCGDSAIPVTVQIEPTQGVLRAALEKLLSIKDKYYGQSGLYNSLYQSTLQVQSVSISNGKATVQLTGSMILAGECDNPRVQAQIEGTVMQFSTVTSADIFINGKTLAEALSLK